ncbi:MAG: acyltransferase domain-containing protein [Bacteroidales bacterium]|nr:acyltransferase domain-containing protein [Bacteroidales bacterium]
MEENYNGLEIAVIGMSGKFPQSKDIETFWNNLKKGKELITFFNDNELLEAGISENEIKNPNYIKAIGYLHDSECFDSNFFGYAPNEVEVMDPQLRLFHEHAWKALEDAGCIPDTFKGSIGVFAGASGKFNWEASNYIKGQYTWENSQVIDKDNLATRIAYKLNLRGPAVTIYTACSTSLVAINSACLGILSGQCDIALAGGVTFNPEKMGYTYKKGMINSPDGHNRSFDEKAGGTVIGNGIGIVVLKRLQDALDDGDNIYAIVKGTAINNDGNRKVGFTAPSIEGQAEVIRTAMQMAEVDFESISYVECHGTATSLGDPVEVEGLKSAFNLDIRNSCAIGSVKSNAGHLDAAAGVIGFIKTVLCLNNKTLVPSLHFKNPNPKIDIDNSPFYVNTETKEWKNDKYPLRAGVTSLGVGGTNAHAILEEPPQIKSSIISRDCKILLISGKTKTALENNIQNLKEYLVKNSDINFADIAYTLQIGRKHFFHRKMFVCSDIKEGIENIDNKLKIKSKLTKNTNKNVVFMFSGQGSQYVNMGRGLYEKESCFKESIDKCSEIIKKRLGFDIREILFAADDSKSQNESKINQVLYTQPIKFVFEYSLAKLLINIGIKPDYMIGHSFGEIGVACLSGVFSLEDALEVVALRSELMESVDPGLMMSVNMTEEKIYEYISKYSDISLAAINGQDLCIVSGKVKDIEEFEQVVTKDGFDTLMLKVPRAGHSNMMIPIMEKFRQRISQMKLNEPKIPYISGLSGDWIKNEEATSDRYWSRHLRETIKFSKGISNLLKKGDTVFVQLGSDKGLVSFVELNEKVRNSDSAINLIKHKKELIDDNEYFANQIGELWLNGVEIDWVKYYAGEIRHKVSLPSYEFDKHKFESKVNIEKLISQKLQNSEYAPKERRRMSEWFYAPSWEQAVLLKKDKNVIISEKLLIFCNASKLCKDVIKNLKENNHEITEVWLDLNYEILDKNKYSIKANCIDDLICLKNEFIQKDTSFNKVLHFWNFGEISGNKDENNIHDIEIDKGYRTIINIVKELLDFLSQNSQIVSVTSGACNINDEETLCPERGMIGTLLKVIGQEIPGIDTKIIDVEYPCFKEKLQLSNIINEIFTKSKERVIAYRYGKRLAESYRSINIEIKEKSNLLKTGGVYIITGGLGGIGLDIAEYLGKVYKAKVILLGRSQFPSRNEWDNWINEKGLDDSISKKILVIKEIELEGGTVRTYNLNVSDKKKLEFVFNESKKEFGFINGVFHFAGVINSNYFVPVTKLTEEINKEHFNPKLYGLMALRQIIKKHSIDFCFVTSSVSSILGGLGFGAYACSNIYMNGVINNDLRNGSIPWINVDLDGWFSSRDKKDANELSEKYVLTAEGTKLIENILSLKECGLGYVVQSISDLNDRLEKWVVNLTKENTELKSESESEIQLYSRPELSNEFVEPKTEMEVKITEIWNMFFRYEKIGIMDDFFELGGNSLKAMRLFSILHKEFGVRIGVKEIFKRPTIALLVEYLNNNMEEIII